MVTHSSTSRPVQCLCMAERTGCPVLTDLWSYVLNKVTNVNMKIAVCRAPQSPIQDKSVPMIVNQLPWTE
jgi:hypothetical protein